MQSSKIETIIKPKPIYHFLDISELIRYRELLLMFAWRDLKVRYRQTFFGVLWAIFQPLFTMFVFTIFFGNIAQIPSGEIPYALFVLIGLVFWNYFSNIITMASGSLIENEHIIKKVYFPRIALPLSKILTALLDFSLAYLILLITLLFFRFPISLSFVLLTPIAIVVASIGASGLGLLLSAFNVKYRDVRYALPFFIQMLVFFTPVIYPTSAMRESFRYIVAINPMTGLIEALRASVAGNPINWDIFAISTFSALILAIIGIIYFKMTERFFADII